jgi:nucleoid-associated protein YgaU
MSVATEFEPIFNIPERARRTQSAPCPARPSATPQRLATVTTLHRPPAEAVAPPLRLTRRGVHAVAAAVAVLAIGLVLFARASAPSAPSSTAHHVPDTVTVQAGDTLWSIASRLAPQRDPRAEIADLQQLNRLGGAALVPGQVLRTH